jgi:uncharacterized protein (TIGR03437 family)
VVYAIGPGGGGCLTNGSGYLFKSTDFGSTWNILAVGQDFGGRLYVDPHDSQVLYGSNTGPLLRECTSTNGGRCGLYKSSDGGKTWIDLPLPAPVVNSLTFDATPNVLYAVVPFNILEFRVMKSVNGGSTWTTLNLDPVVGLSVPMTNLTGDPGAASTVFLTSSDRIFRTLVKSTDGGANWTRTQIPEACDPPAARICSWPPDINALVAAPPAPGPPPAPVISANGVVNAASLRPGIAANSWVTIFGNNLAPRTNNWNSAIVDGRLPATLDGVSVSIGGKPAYVNFISPGQVNVLAPDVPSGTVPVTVTTSGGVSAALTATASQYGPAFFLWPGNQPVATRQDFSLVAKAGTFPGATTVPAQRGDVLILWGTGFGPTVPATPLGVTIPSTQTYSTATVPAVTINNTPVTVYGAALAPGFAGLYQVAIQVPTGLADGDWPIQATIGGVPSPGGTLLSVGAGGGRATR